MFERIKRWFVHRTAREDTKMNVTDISRGKTLRKIKSLESYIKDYNVIKNIKQTYLNSLQQHTKYSNINIECHRINEEIIFLNAQLSNMDGKLLLLRKEL